MKKPECHYVRIEVCRPENKTWSQCFIAQERALDRAIKNASAADTASLMDIKSIMYGIRKEIVGDSVREGV